MSNKNLSFFSIQTSHRGWPTAKMSHEAKNYKPTWPIFVLRWKKTQILIAHQKQTIDRTKKGRLAAKKSSARD
jgi:hypothetical protein